MGSICLKRTPEEAVKRHQKTLVPQPATGLAEYFDVSIASAVQPQWCSALIFFILSLGLLFSGLYVGAISSKSQFSASLAVKY